MNQTVGPIFKGMAFQKIGCCLETPRSRCGNDNMLLHELLECRYGNARCVIETSAQAQTRDSIKIRCQQDPKAQRRESNTSTISPKEGVSTLCAVTCVEYETGGRKTICQKMPGINAHRECTYESSEAQKLQLCIEKLSQGARYHDTSPPRTTRGASQSTPNVKKRSPESSRIDYFMGQIRRVKTGIANTTAHLSTLII